MPHLTVSVAVEGPLDEAVLRRLVEEAGTQLGVVHGKIGKAHLLQRLRGYNNAARLAPWVVLVDLDRDADCAPPFCAAHLAQPAPHMTFRVAVREIEAWLLADREEMSRFLSIPIARLPHLPDTLEDPKAVLIDLARRARRRAIREDIVPRPESGRQVGPAYSSRLIEFAQQAWRPEVAKQSSDSLRRCIRRLQDLGAQHPKD